MDDQGGGGFTRPQRLEVIMWPPPVTPPETILSAKASARKGGPVTFAGVLGLILALVLSVAVLGKDDLLTGTREVAGTPVAAAGQPNAAGAPRGTTPPTSGTSTPKARSVMEPP